jgi:hypothetical protein
MPVLKVTEEHLKCAIEARKLPSWYITEKCIIGQAARDLFGDNFKWCAYDQIKLKDGTKWINEKVREIINLFDCEKYDEISLPIDIELTEQRKEEPEYA